MSPKNRTRNKYTVVFDKWMSCKNHLSLEFSPHFKFRQKMSCFPLPCLPSLEVDLMICTGGWDVSRLWSSCSAEFGVSFNSIFLFFDTKHFFFFQLLFFREINVCFENTWKTEKNTDTHGPSTAADACPPGFLFWHLAFSDMTEK